jgi:hypothetical protein
VQRPNVDPGTGAEARAVGLVYANALEGVSVRDCTGKIYLRGFCVDGGNEATMTTVTSQQRTNIGFDIQNSEVVIENCTVLRCKKVGMQAVNSNVILNRGFIAAHNYELKDGGATLSEKVDNIRTPGLRAISSNITLSASTEDAKGLPIDAPFCFYRNMVGIELENSNLITPPGCRGGLTPTNIAAQTPSPAGENFGSQEVVLQSFYNVHEGITAKNSLLDTAYRVASFQNEVGIKLQTSTFKVGGCAVDRNQNGGIVANNSYVNYNKNAISSFTAGAFYPINNFIENGQHILLDASEFVPTYVSGMNTISQVFALHKNHAITEVGSSKQTLPAVEVNNSSYMLAAATQSFLHDYLAENGYYLAGGVAKGSAFRVTNQSNLDLYGHGTVANTIIGPRLYSSQQKAAALYAGNNSHISVAGPTTICQTGIDALAEDNSTVEFGPHQKDGMVDASGWGLESAVNQTQVQLHATRACLVANRNSTIDMHDMGDYHGRWNGKYLISPDYPTGSTYDISAYCSSGYLQFYPNPFVTLTGAELGLVDRYPTTTANVEDQTSLVKLPWTDTAGELTKASYGGMCVRAVGSSRVKAQNVWFPAGWINTSGPYYDAHGGAAATSYQCDLLRIWNIADNSELHASYLSVGNVENGGEGHPQDLSGQYYGPSAVWVSGPGATGPGSTGLSGAPSSTPDTSGLSVLDSFGLGIQTKGEAGYYGKTEAQNIGPFRIYVSPHPKAKFLGYPRTSDGNFYPYTPYYLPTYFQSMGFSFPETADLVVGAPYQLFSQGYATSSDCSAINSQGPNYTNVSAIYQDLGFSGYITTVASGAQGFNDASSFFYTSAMLPYDTQNRIWLDESAMNTFANAKNGTLNTSGRRKIVSYYQTPIIYPGEGDPGMTDASPISYQGGGIRSVNLFDLDRDL